VLPKRTEKEKAGAEQGGFLDELEKRTTPLERTRREKAFDWEKKD